MDRPAKSAISNALNKVWHKNTGADPDATTAVQETRGAKRKFPESQLNKVQQKEKNAKWDP